MSSKPQTLWAVKGPKGYIDLLTIRFTRRDAIESFLGPHIKWPYWYRRGYRAVKVKVEEVK